MHFFFSNTWMHLLESEAFSGQMFHDPAAAPHDVCPNMYYTFLTSYAPIGVQFNYAPFADKQLHSSS